MNDLCIRGGAVVTPEGLLKADIGIREEAVWEISPRVEAMNYLDAGGAIVLPGMIDTHVHIRGGAFSHREDFSSGTFAAACGGVTTILEMPVAKPPASTVEAFKARRRELEGASCVDVALYGGAGADNLSVMADLAKAGAVAFKTFMMAPPKGREEEFFGLCAEDDDSLRRVMKAAAGTSLPLAVHAEDNSVIAPLVRELSGSELADLASWERSRPAEAETAAVRRVIAAAGETGCRTIICHTSTREALEMIRDARRDGVDIYAESCPQYVMLDYENAAPCGVFARIKPPLRSPEAKERLLEGLCSSMVDFIGSDHAPYRKEEKERGGNIWRTVDGMPGLEFSLLLMANLVTEGKLTYEHLARITSGSPAEVFRLSQKGAVKVGLDADLTILEPVGSWSMKTTDMKTKSSDSASIFERFSFSHRIAHTLSRGRIVTQRGEREGYQGRFIKPAVV
ncbi:MAG: dihydroorotase family protein [Synergistaceae bacterium]|jgi:allantoinase|nr:dihydroorotase family protein [Synergistaceae bacterium]